MFSVWNQISGDNEAETKTNQVLDFGFMTAIEMLKALEGAESIGKICVTITSWACRDKVHRVESGAIVSCTSMILSFPLFISHGLYC
jgi:hypothetical protein